MANKIEKQVVIIVTNKGLKEAIKDVDGLSAATDGAGKSTGVLSNQQRENRKTQEALFNANNNATKSFSKQQRQLSGLVRVYAVTAANVFALTAAYDVLKKGADFRILQESAAQLSKSTGVNFASVADDLREITGGALSMSQAFQTANLGISGGATTSQLTKITEIATKAANALGRNVPEAVNRMTQAVIKAEPELVDEFGIILRIKEASDAYGASIGKTAKELNTFERQQAIINQLIEQGTDRFKDVEKQANPFQQLSTGFADLTLAITSLVGGPIGALASAVSESATTILSVLVLITASLIKQVAPSFREAGLAAAEGASEAAKEFDRLIAKTKELAKAQEDLNFQRNKARLGESPSIKNAEASLRKIDRDTDLFGGLSEKTQLKAAARGTNVAGGQLVQAFTTSFAKLRPQIEKELKELDGLTAAQLKKIGGNANELAVEFGGQVSILTRKQAESILKIGKTAVVEGIQDIQSFGNSTRGVVQSVGENISQLNVKFTQLRAGIASVAAASASANSKIVNAPSLVEAGGALRDIIFNTDEFAKSGTKAAKAANFLGNSVVKLSASVTFAGRALGELISFVFKWLAIITITIQAIKFLADALGLVNKEEEKANEATEAFTEKLEGLGETLDDLDTKMNSNVRSIQELADKYKFASNFVNELTGDITKAASTLQKVSKRGFFSGTVFGTSEAEDSVANILTTLDILNSRFNTTQTIKILVAGGEEVQLTSENISSLTRELDNLSVQGRIEEQTQAAAEAFRKLATELAGATEDIKNSVRDLNKDSTTELDQFRRSLSTFPRLKALQDINKNFAIVEKQLGSTTEAAVALLASLNDLDRSRIGVTDADVAQLKEAAELEASLIKLRQATTVEDKILVLNRLISSEELAQNKEVQKAIRETTKALRERLSTAERANALATFIPFLTFDAKVVKKDTERLENLIQALADKGEKVAENVGTKLEQEEAKQLKFTENEALLTKKAADASARASRLKKRADTGALSDLKASAAGERAAAFSRINLLKNELSLLIEKNSGGKEVPPLQKTANESAISALRSKIALEVENVRFSTDAIVTLKDQVVQHSLINKSLKNRTAIQEEAHSALVFQQEINAGSIADRVQLIEKIKEQSRAVIDANNAEVKGQIAKLKVEANLATSLGKINEARDKGLEIEAKQIELSTSKLEIKQNELEAAQNINEVEQDRIKIAESQVSLAKRVLTFNKSIADNRELPAASRLQALEQERSIEIGTARAEFLSLQVRKNSLEALNKSLLLQGSAAEQEVRRNKILELQVEQAEVLTKLSTKSLSERQRENEIRQQALKDGAGSFGEALSSSLDVVAREFDETMRSSAEQVSDAIVASIDKGVDSFIDNIEAIGNDNLSAGDALVNVFQDVGDVINEEAKKSLKEDLKGFLFSTFKIGDDPAKATELANLKTINETLTSTARTQTTINTQVGTLGKETTLLSMLEVLRTIARSNEQLMSNPVVNTGTSDATDVASTFSKTLGSVFESSNSNLNDGSFASNIEFGVASGAKSGISSGFADIKFESQSLESIVPKSNQFAEGGIVSKPTLALIGEDGAELITPLTGSNKQLDFDNTKLFAPMFEEFASVIPKTLKEELRKRNKGVQDQSSLMQSVLADVPRLAEGGIVNSATLAIVGESGAEAIIPLAELGTSIQAGNLSSRDIGGQVADGNSFEGNRAGRTDFLIALQQINETLEDANKCACFQGVADAIIDAIAENRAIAEKNAENASKSSNTSAALTGGLAIGGLIGQGITNAFKSFDFGGGDTELVNANASLFTPESASDQLFRDDQSTFFSEPLKFAEGGVVNGATSAIVGEAGPEAIIPLKGGNVQVQLQGEGSAAPIAQSIAAASVKALIKVDESLSKIADQTILQTAIQAQMLAVQQQGFASLTSAVGGIGGLGISKLGDAGSSAGSSLAATAVGAAVGATINVVGNLISGALTSAAKGGIFPKGIRRMATGGVADQPELALIGEGDNSEAVVPLPDNRSIPVRFSGSGAEPSANIVVNVNGIRDEGELAKTSTQIAAAAGRETRRALRRNT